MNKIEFFKKYIFFSYGINNVITFLGGGVWASQEDILGLAISLIFDQFSIL